MHIFINCPKFIPKFKRTPYPSHRDCAHLMIENKEYQKWIMVHGFVKRKNGFKRYAWLERAGKVFDVKAKKITTKSEFYKDKRPIGKMLFDYEDVRHNMKFFRRYGKWEL